MSCKKGLFDKTLFDQALYGAAVILAVFALFNPSQFQTQPFDTEQVCPVSDRPLSGGGSGFLRQGGKVKVTPQGARSYREPQQKVSAEYRRMDDDILDFIVRFTIHHL